MQKFLRNEMNDVEREELDAWLNRDFKNRQKFEEVKQVWELTGQFDTPIYALEEEKQKLYENIENYRQPLRRHKSSLRFKTVKWFWWAAAVVLLIMATVYVTWIYANRILVSNSNEQILVSNELGSKIGLPDSSIIYLNKKSKVSFSQNSEQRTAHLNGEAFFEVENNKRPFTVKAQNITVKVLGTSFNIRAFEDENEIHVTTISGEVEISNGLKSIQVRTGERAVLNRLKNTVEKSLDIDPNFMAWKTQRLVFRNVALKNVIYTLSEYYGVTFQIKTPAILDCKFTGSFEKARLETVMEVLAYSLGFEYYYDRDKYVLTGSRCR